MNQKKAIRLAIEALGKYKQRFVVNANLYKRGIISPATERDKKKYDEIIEAIKVLSANKENSG